MKFTVRRAVFGNMFQSRITFAEFGTDALLDVEEMYLINSLRPVTASFSGVFEGKYRFDPLQEKVIEDPAGDTVQIYFSHERYNLDETLDITYMVGVTNLRNSECGDHLTTKRHVAEAKALLGEKVILEEIQKSLTAIRDQWTSFAGPAETVVL